MMTDIEVLGWDCANRTLAHAHYFLDTHIAAKLAALIPALRAAKKDIAAVTAVIDAMLVIVRGFYRPVTARVDDILGVKLTETTLMQRTRVLHGYLRGAKVPVIGDDCLVGVEYQPPKVGAATNSASIAVGSQLAYHYVDHQCELISPKIKNAISFHPDLVYDVFFDAAVARIEHPVGSQKYKDAVKRAKYTAAKKHTTANWRYFHKVFGASAHIAAIAKPVADDAADAWYTAWIRAKYHAGWIESHAAMKKYI